MKQFLSGIYGLISVALSANNFATKDISYLYDPAAEIHIRHEVIHGNNETHVYLLIQKRSKLYELDDYLAFQQFQNDYSEKLGKEDTIKLVNSIIIRKNDLFYFKLSFPNPVKNLMIFHLKNIHNQKDYYYDIPLVKGKLGNYQLLLKDQGGLPVLNPYISTSVPVTIETSGDELIYSYLYKRDFEIAEPPMVTQLGKVNPNLSIDSSFLMLANRETYLTGTGLYFFQSDSASILGKGIRVHSGSFPKVGTITEMIDALRYFSTRSEWNKLNQAVDKKKALDNYWLQVTKSKEKAKRIIKEYFKNVANSNMFFTNYKEGWKTDRGMIYIIFGNPDEVYRNKDTELWIYNKAEELPKIKFSFAAVPNIFTDDHYVLIRDKSFQNHWFRAIDLWRKGRYHEIRQK